MVETIDNSVSNCVIKTKEKHLNDKEKLENRKQEKQLRIEWSSSHDKYFTCTIFVFEKKRGRNNACNYFIILNLIN